MMQTLQFLYWIWHILFNNTVETPWENKLNQANLKAPLLLEYC